MYIIEHWNDYKINVNDFILFFIVREIMWRLIVSSHCDDNIRDNRVFQLEEPEKPVQDPRHQAVLAVNHAVADKMMIKFKAKRLHLRFDQ